MIAALSLEKFGSHEHYASYMGRDKSNPWVAKILGLDDQFGFAREFMRGYTDYSKASGTGARGIYIHYALKNGIYEVNERVSWKHVKRYFIRVQGTRITEISREDVLASLKPRDPTNEGWD